MFTFDLLILCFDGFLASLKMCSDVIWDPESNNLLSMEAIWIDRKSQLVVSLKAYQVAKSELRVEFFKQELGTKIVVKVFASDGLWSGLWCFSGFEYTTKSWSNQSHHGRCGSFKSAWTISRQCLILMTHFSRMFIRGSDSKKANQCFEIHFDHCRHEFVVQTFFLSPSSKSMTLTQQNCPAKSATDCRLSREQLHCYNPESSVRCRTLRDFIYGFFGWSCWRKPIFFEVIHQSFGSSKRRHLFSK